MKILKLDLLTVLISLFILSSCNNPDLVGLDVDPTNSINTSVDENSTVKSFTVAEDLVPTSSLSQYPIGYLNDPQAGITGAAVAATINLPENNLKFGSDIVLDSAVLVLKYGSNFYGDSLNSSYHFTVHQLTDKLNTATTYYNNTPIDYNAGVIGSLTVNKIGLKDSVDVKQLLEGKKDTIITEAPQLRIPIDPTFIETNFFNASADKFADASSFINHIKGLYIKADLPDASDAGGIPFFDLNSGSSKLMVYYRNDGATTKDTNTVVFTINNNSSTVVAHFTHDYSGTAIETQLANPTTEYETNFVQAMGGVRTKITFPDLNNLKQLGNIIINKAILEIKIANGSDAPFAPAPRLILYRTDIAGQRQPIPELNFYDGRYIGFGGFGGVYNADTQTYSMTITSYIQDILGGKSKQYAAYLAVIDKNTTNAQAAISPMGTIADKAVLGGGSSGSIPMKLRIIYTKLNY